MKRKLKELIDNAEYREGGKYEWFLLVPTNKKYDGFWGKNGYNNIIVLGYDKKDSKYYRLDKASCDSVDIMDITNSIKFDVPGEYGCVRIWGYYSPYEVKSQLSTITAYEKGGNTHIPIMNAAQAFVSALEFERRENEDGTVNKE